jgi:hypothetical protein
MARLVNSYSLQFVTSRTKSSFSVCHVFTGRRLLTAFTTMYIPQLPCSRPYRLLTVSEILDSSRVWPPLATSQSRPLNQSQIYVTTDGQSVCLSWCQAPIWIPKNRFLLLSHSCGLVDIGASFLKRGRVCRLQLLLFLASTVVLESRGTHSHILQSHIGGSPNLEAQVSVFISTGKGWSSYTLEALGSILVASYDSQG